MVGKGVLLECLDDQRISEVLIINRNSINHSHAKLTEILLKDFNQVESINDQLAGYDACYFCAGVSAVGKSEEEYRQISYEMTLHFAQTFLDSNNDSVFCYVSGQGTDSSEKSRAMWARVKGKTENDLLQLPFKKAYMFRPGYIQPMRGITSRTNWYSALYAIFRPIYALLRHLPGAATNTTNVGLAMINILDKLPDLPILENRQINEWSQARPD